MAKLAHSIIEDPKPVHETQFDLIMKNCIPSPRAAALRLLALSTSLFLATSTHAQPGPSYALRFDGSGNFVAVPHTTALNAFPLTVMAWVKTSQSTAHLVNKYVSSSLNGWDMFIRAGHVRAW